jgi:uncharacterized protein YqeY
MKIQINSLAALERLIGGDTELEIEVRNSVVQAFSKKHLKSVADSLVETGVVRLIQAEISTEVFKTISYSNTVINPKYEALLQSKIDFLITEKLKELADKKLSEIGKLEDYFQARLNQKLDKMVQEAIATVTKEEVTMMARKLLMDKLGA